MALMPDWAQQLTHTAQPRAVQRWALQPSDRLRARLLRWVVPDLPCEHMALARMKKPALGSEEVGRADSPIEAGAHLSGGASPFSKVSAYTD